MHKHVQAPGYRVCVVPTQVRGRERTQGNITTLTTSKIHITWLPLPLNNFIEEIKKTQDWGMQYRWQKIEQSVLLAHKRNLLLAFVSQVGLQKHVVGTSKYLKLLNKGNFLSNRKLWLYCSLHHYGLLLLMVYFKPVSIAFRKK